MVLTQILTQAREASKLLSSIKRADRSESVDPKFDTNSDFMVGSKEPFNHPCLQLGRIPDPSEAGTEAAYGDPGTLASQPVSLDVPSTTTEF